MPIRLLSLLGHPTVGRETIILGMRHYGRLLRELLAVGLLFVNFQGNATTRLLESLSLVGAVK